MRYILLALLLACISEPAHAQNCEFVVLDSQADVNAFSCTDVEILVIQGNDITDLTPLSVLTSVLDLNINNNPMLVSLVGLGNAAKEGGDLIIESNALLESLEGLEGVLSAGIARIANNASLESVDGLENLTQIIGFGGGAGSLTIEDNPMLVSLAGLGSLSRLQELFIVNNDALPSLVGLESLSRVGNPFGGRVEVASNDGLVSLDGLQGLDGGPGEPEVSGDIVIRSNAALTSLTGLDNLVVIGGAGDDRDGLSIANNDMLTSLQGLEALEAMSGLLSISDNDALTSIAELDGLAFISGLSIENNPLLASLAGLDDLFPEVDPFFFDPLTVRGNDALISLEELRRISPDIAGSVTIEDNDALVSLAGLEGIRVVDEDLVVEDNDALETLLGLQGLIDVSGDLDVRDNDALNRCSCGLSNLITGDPPAFTGIDGSVTIANNDPAGTCTSPSAVLALTCNVPTNLIFEVSASGLTVAPGGTVSFSLFIYNNGDNPATGDLWFTAERGGTTVARGLVASRTLPRFDGLTGSYRQRVPVSTTPGTYTYTVNVGDFLNDVAVESEVFEITVTGSAREGGSEAWTVADVKPWEVVDETRQIEAAASEALPSAFSLAAAYPNPFASATTVNFALPEAADVRVAVLDVLGREVAVLAEGTMEAGRHTARFEANSLASGVYLVRMTAVDFAAVQRVTLAR